MLAGCSTRTLFYFVIPPGLLVLSVIDAAIGEYVCRSDVSSVGPWNAVITAGATIAQGGAFTSLRWQKTTKFPNEPRLKLTPVASKTGTCGYGWANPIA
jgi:hypothetical protein